MRIGARALSGSGVSGGDLGGRCRPRRGGHEHHGRHVDRLARAGRGGFHDGVDRSRPGARCGRGYLTVVTPPNQSLQQTPAAQAGSGFNGPSAAGAAELGR